MAELEDDEQYPLPWLGKPEMPTDDDSDARPTIGQRMAGDVPKPAPAPVDTPAPAMPQVQVDPSKLPAGILAAPTPSQVPKPPTGANNPNRIDLMRQQATLGEPLNRQDPKYRPGVGTRILRGVSDFMSGGIPGTLRGAIDPNAKGYYGPGAVNRQFTQDEATRQAKLGNVTTQLGEQEKLDTSNQKMYEDAIKQAYETQLGGAKDKLAAAAEENAATKASLVDSQRQLNDARANKADQDKVPTNEFSGWYSAFKQQNGRPPNAKEIQQYEVNKRQAGKDTSASDLAKSIQIAEFKQRQMDTIDRAKEAERVKKYDELDKNVTVKYSPERLAAAKQKIDSDLEAKYAPKIQQMSDEADKMLGLTKSGTKLQSGGNAPPAKIDPNNLPATVQVRQKDGTTKTRKVAGYNKTTGKVTLAPE